MNVAARIGLAAVGTAAGLAAVQALSKNTPSEPQSYDAQAYGVGFGAMNAIGGAAFAGLAIVKGGSTLGVIAGAAGGAFMAVLGAHSVHSALTRPAVPNPHI